MTYSHLQSCWSSSSWEQYERFCVLFLSDPNVGFCVPFFVLFIFLCSPQCVPGPVFLPSSSHACLILFSSQVFSIISSLTHLLYYASCPHSPVFVLCCLLLSFWLVPPIASVFQFCILFIYFFYPVSVSLLTKLDSFWIFAGLFACFLG